MDATEWLWDTLKYEHGYVTSLGEAECVSPVGFIAQPTDYFFRKEWCVLDYAFDAVDPSSAAPRCVGTTPVHQTLLSHAKQVWALHADGARSDAHVAPTNGPVFGMYSFMEGHEARGTVLQTIDTDLRDFLSHMTSRHPDTVVVMMSDHGLRFSRTGVADDVDAQERARLEVNNPLVSVIVPRDRLAAMDARPESEGAVSVSQALVDNARGALVTAYDLYATLRHLASYPRVPEYTATSEDGDSGPGLSLLRPVPRGRSCADAHVPDANCLATTWVDATEDPDPGVDVALAANTVAKAVALLSGSGQWGCEVPEVVRVVSAFAQRPRDEFQLDGAASAPQGERRRGGTVATQRSRIPAEGSSTPPARVAQAQSQSQHPPVGGTAAPGEADAADRRRMVRVTAELQRAVVFEATLVRLPLSHPVPGLDAERPVPFGKDNSVLELGGYRWDFLHLARLSAMGSCFCDWEEGVDDVGQPRWVDPEMCLCAECEVWTGGTTL